MRELSQEFDLWTIGFVQEPHQPTREEREEAVEELGHICRYVRAFRIPTDSNRLAWAGLLAANILSSQPYSAWRFRARGFHRELKDLLDRVQFDIVYADTVATAGHALAAEGEAKLVLNHHNVESSLLRRRAERAATRVHGAYLRHQARKLEAWETRMCPRFDLNQTVSSEDADVLREHAPDARYEVVPNGTDVRYFSPAGEPATGHEMVFAGGGTWMPNRDAMSWFVRDIFPLIARQVPDTVMNVIGSKPPPDVVEAGESDPRIRVHGFVPDIRPILARSSVYVVPIRVGGGTRLKILDAFASGKAVVSTTVGCEGIECVDGVHIRMADTPEAFAASVVGLFENADARLEMEREARQLAERRYAWPIIGSDLRASYRSLLA